MSTNDLNLKDKYGSWAIIVGASHGIGAEFSRQVAAQGMNCVLLARTESALLTLQTDLEKTYSVKTRIVCVDLTSDSAVATITQGIQDLDIGLLIYNAGSPPYASTFLEAPLEDWHKLVRLNVTTLMELCYHLGDAMVARGRGGLLLVGSQAGLGGNKKYGMYTGTKGFMLNFGESLWIELKDKGVDVLNLLISVVDSPTLRTQMKKSDMPGWDQDDIGVPTAVELATIGLQQLASGPTFLHPDDVDTPDGQLSGGEQRKEAMVERWAITAPFVGED